MLQLARLLRQYIKYAFWTFADSDHSRYAAGFPNYQKPLLVSYTLALDELQSTVTCLIHFYNHQTTRQINLSSFLHLSLKGSVNQTTICIRYVAL